MDVKQWYNPGATGSQISRRENAGTRTMSQQSNPGELERNAAVARRVWGSIFCSSVQSPTHLSQIIPFVTLSNKVRGIFSARPYCVEYVSACIWLWVCYIDNRKAKFQASRIRRFNTRQNEIKGKRKTKKIPRTFQWIEKKRYEIWAWEEYW